MLVHITSASCALYPDVECIYLEAFPPAERRPLQKLHRLIEHEERFCLTAIVLDDVVAGLMATWAFPQFRYVEYLAVEQSLRGQHIGSGALGDWLQTSSLPVILEVELPEDDLSRRRVAFYERMGFSPLPHPYLQPSYGEVPGLPLQLMLWGETDLDVEGVIRTLHREVYGVR